MSEFVFDFVRPGLALYGVSPFLDQNMSSLKPVMHLCARVMQLRDIAAGDYVSYGGTYQAKEAMRLALLPLGYADGLVRSLSNCGYASFQGVKLQIIGRICMDYCLLEVSDSRIKVGDELCFFGDFPLLSDVAVCARTISYSLLTGIGSRVQRIFLD